jgi:hypothetical protein
MGIEDLAAGLDDLARNREALALLILHGERAVPVLAEVLLGPPSSIPDARRLAAEGLGATGGARLPVRRRRRWSPAGRPPVTASTLTIRRADRSSGR